MKYLEDLVLASWYTETLCTAIELGIFTVLEPEGKTLVEIGRLLDLEPVGTEFFLEALCTLGLLGRYGEIYFNSVVAQDYLVKGRVNYLGDSLLARPFLTPKVNGQTLRQRLQKGIRMELKKEQVECLALNHLTPSIVQEILPLFANQDLRGNLLAVGSGAEAITEAFLAYYPELRAVLLGNVHTEMNSRCTYYSIPLLEPWNFPEKEFDLIILSNLMLAYSASELSALLAKLDLYLKPSGFLLIHDAYREQNLEKASLLDLNLWANHSRGQVISAQWVREQLAVRHFFVSELYGLSSDTALLLAAKDEQTLHELAFDREDQLIARLKRLGFVRAQSILVQDVQIPGWTDLRCRYGCSSYGQPQCSPDRNTSQKTKEMLDGFTRGILLEGTPPTRDFQHQVLKAEREAFLTGYYKALAFWAGPCSLCEFCGGEGGCRNHKEARSSMESAGIDVYATVRKAGISLRTIADPRDYVKYFALLLLE